jgi:exosortase
VNADDPIVVSNVETLRWAEPRAKSVEAGRWVSAHRWPLLFTGLLVAILYATNIAKLCSSWWTDENYAHGFIVPVAFFWMLWRRRQELATCKVAPQPWAIGIVALALFQLAAGTWGVENFVADSSLLLLLSGMTLYLFGSKMLRRVAFPIAWLIFMIPLPAVVFYSITFPLQLLASKLAVGILDVLRVPCVSDGNILYLAHFTADVAEACSGIRALMSILAFSLLIAYLVDLRSWWALAIAAFPVALGVNAVRVAGTGLMGNYLGAQWAEGFFHTFSGWLLFMGSLGVMLAIVCTLRHLEQRADAERPA